MPSQPYIRFFPDSWMNDARLRKCSRQTRATWMDLICLMHQGTPYGFLADESGPLPIKFIANWCEMTTRQLTAALEELEKFGVFSRDSNKKIFSRRMVSDEETRKKRASGGARSVDNARVPRREGYPLPINVGEGVKDTPIALDIVSNPQSLEDSEETRVSAIPLSIPRGSFVLDETFMRFMAEVEATGAALIEADYADAHDVWLHEMDTAERLYSIASFREKREAGMYSNAALVMRPFKWLKRKEFNRKTIKSRDFPFDAGVRPTKQQQLVDRIDSL